MSKKIRIGLNLNKYSEIAEILFSKIEFGNIHQTYNQNYWTYMGSELEKDSNGRLFYNKNLEKNKGKPFIFPYIQIKEELENPEEAIEDFIKNPKLYRADCSTIIMMTWTYSIYDTLKSLRDSGLIKKHTFNSLINNKLSIGVSAKRTTLVELRESIITDDFSNELNKYEKNPVGSRFIYMNTRCQDKLGAEYNYSNENFTKVNSGYLAQGLNSEPVKSLLEIKRLYGTTTKKECNKILMKLDKYIEKYIKLQSYQIYSGPILEVDK